MSVTSDFYRDRAAECAREGAAATLDNVRDRCRRSEEAWLAMADRLTRSEALRAKQASEKQSMAEAELMLPAQVA